MRRVGRSGRRPRPLATKFFLFTATLVFWVVAVIFAYDLRAETFDASRAILLLVVIVLVAGAIAQFTSRVLARPLSRLREGITAVQNGELASIEVSRTRDEVEFLGESFNQMIQALAVSHEEIRLRNAELEAAILRAHNATVEQNEFLAGLSHQLGAPINQLAEILDRTSEAQTGESLEQLETAQRCADTLLTLLNQLRPEVQVDVATGVTRR
jgi:signal transduction histidine kinase